MKAVSPMLSTAVLLAIIITSTFVVVNTVGPMIEKGEETAAFEAGKSALITIDNIMKELIYEAPGARRTVSLSISKGKFIISGSEDEIKFEIYPKTKILEPGTVVKEGNIIISYGPSLKGYEEDVNNDGNVDLVLENGAVLFAVRKLYSSNNPGFINLSDTSTPLITLIKNKLTNTIINPTFKVSFNDDVTTTYGYGYTELLTVGDNLHEGTIKLHLYCPDSADSITYEVYFKLMPGQDFVHVYVKKL